MQYQFRRWYVRDDMVEALESYVRDGVPLGGFLKAVVCNDFAGAAGKADNWNLDNLPAFGAYVYNEMPSTSHGSIEIYDAWLRRKAAERDQAA